jgi:hypothetical protein
MSFSMASLLAHSEHVPAAARNALLAARTAAGEEKNELLESAARILFNETGVACPDALELVDLRADDAEC